MGGNDRGSQCPREQLSTGATVCGSNCPWEQLPVGATTRGSKCPREQILAGGSVRGAIVRGGTVCGSNCPREEVTGEEVSGEQLSAGASVWEEVSESKCLGSKCPVTGEYSGQVAEVIGLKLMSV